MADQERRDNSGGFWQWTFPSLFILCGGWIIWHIPSYVLDFYPPKSESLLSQIGALRYRKDVTPDMMGLFGGVMDPIDWIALILLPVFLILGMMTVRVAPMEFPHWRPWDRLALFIGRVTMMLIIGMTCVMLYEVFLRYALEAPTLWANELTLWIGGFVFLLSGFYGMQQRSHIRIFLLWEICPRWLQRIFDGIWVSILCVFTFFLIFGSFKQVFYTKFYKWEMWGTAFDPPIPATIQPMVLIVVSLVTIQAVLNYFADWNLTQDKRSAEDVVDEDEIAAIKRGVGVE